MGNHFEENSGQVKEQWDPYAVLGVARGADKEAMKKEYRARAQACHPDTHPNDPNATKKMEDLNRAYKELAKTEPKTDFPEFFKSFDDFLKPENFFKGWNF